MTKKKVTLSLDKAIIDRIKARLSPGETLSEVVEKSLAGFSAEIFLDEVAHSLGLEQTVLSPREVVSARQTGYRAEEVVREIRDEA